ncbi:MAG: 4-(cytidine 5'-diphospho)-2-C-methyl-D-erythritol kinase [Bacteroidetes bacterium B1(2017)]|nr:MAG: 4-(cytidine 5'-diphospho)-2-C-methyl-D-erythritol kinase [Bacteroidetes bacterium B1(2017)]
MIVFPSCKINLGLHILSKRQDGYHELETIFYPVPIYDALEIIEAPLGSDQKVKLSCSGLEVQGNEEQNLVVKAYHLLATDYSLPPIEIALLKNIPMGAGLGGGSSDGAFAIKLLNTYFKLSLSTEKQLDYAAKLGSDCAFFILNKPCVGKGRGEQLEPIELSLSTYWIALVKPNIHISTAEAFAGIIPRDKLENNFNTSLLEIIKSPINTWKEALVNDFEASIFKNHSELNSIKNTLYSSGAVYASMSGSGSSLFGLFLEEPNLKSTFKSHYYFEGKLS